MALSLKQFGELHRAQLHAIGFPPQLLPRLFSKLSAGERESLERWFQVCPDENNTLSACGSVLKARSPLQAFSDVFILRHLWQSDGGQEARMKLTGNPDLLEKIERALGCKENGSVVERGERMKTKMASVVSQQSGRSKSVSLKALRACSYDVIAAIVAAESLPEEGEDAEEEEEEESSREHCDTAVLSLSEFKTGLSSLGDGPATSIPDAQLQALYDDYTQRKSCGGGTRKDEDGWVECGRYRWRDEGEEGVVSVSIPLPVGTEKRRILSKITTKRWEFGLAGEEPMIDGTFCHRAVPDECFWTLDGTNVSLSVQKGDVEREWEGLLVEEVQLGEEEVGRVRRMVRERLVSRVDAVMERMWFVSQTYQAVTPEGSQKPVWYLLEPHGLALTHSSRPNFSCRPFANAVTGQVVSLLWPVVSVGEGSLCSRDYVPELYPGETKQSRAAREATILGFRGSSPSTSLVAVNGELGITPGHLPTLSPVPSSSPPPPSTFPNSPPTPISLYISPSTGHPVEWAEGLAGFSIAPTHSQADVVLGYPELLAGNSSTPTPAPAARLAGDAVLVHKSQFCRLVRGRRGCVGGIDIRGEVAHIAEAGGKGLTGRWYVVCPDGPWSAVTPHVTDCQLEVVRWSEAGAGVATQFYLRTPLHNSQRCCLQFSVVVVSTEAGRTAFLHPHPRVRLAPKPVSSEGFQPWDTAALLTSVQCTVPWSEVLASLQTRYAADWVQVQSEISQAVAALFAAALPCCGGERAVYTVDVILQNNKQLVPVIIGVNPLPSFANTMVAKECLDLLLGQGRTECFIPV